jgi:glycosyltransferase involved in cell wall biosynthesis
MNGFRFDINYITSSKKGDMAAIRDGQPGGDSIGYATGQMLMRRAMLGEGDIVFNEDAKVWIHYCPIHMFEPQKGKINILFSMWEADDLPPSMLEDLNRADSIIVPSVNSLHTFRKAGYVGKIYVCQHGLDTDEFTYKERVVDPNKAVRFLWVGAPNARKGYDLAVKSFFNAFHGTSAKVELYLKSTAFGHGGDFQYLEKYSAVIDTRKLPREELVQLYHNSDVFLFPSRGEGAGLPPLEAMATGLPVIAPAYSAMRDYMNWEIAYPCTYTMIPVEYGCETQSANADLEDLVKLCRMVHSNLPSAWEKGKKAAKFVRENFSLDAMGERLLHIIKEIYRKAGLYEDVVRQHNA